jgi:hypothetical protein
MKTLFFWAAFILMFFALDASDAVGPAGDTTTWQSIKAINIIVGQPSWSDDRGFPPDPWGYCWTRWDPTFCKKIRQRDTGGGPWVYRPMEEPWNDDWPPGPDDYPKNPRD